MRLKSALQGGFITNMQPGIIRWMLVARFFAFASTLGLFQGIYLSWEYHQNFKLKEKFFVPRLSYPVLSTFLL